MSSRIPARNLSVLFLAVIGVLLLLAPVALAGERGNGTAASASQGNAPSNSNSSSPNNNSNGNSKGTSESASNNEATPSTAAALDTSSESAEITKA